MAEIEPNELLEKAIGVAIKQSTFLNFPEKDTGKATVIIRMVFFKICDKVNFSKTFFKKVVVQRMPECTPFVQNLG